MRPYTALFSTAVLLIFAFPTSAAELQLRESLLVQQRDAVTISIPAEVLAILAQPHRLDTSKPLSGDDCDLHMALSTDAIRVPLVGEIQNACSIAPPDASSWKDEVATQAPGNAGTFAGAFRIWMEHPPSDVQTEASPAAPEPGNTNPDHQVELHPLVQIGNLDLRTHIKWIGYSDDEEGFGYGPDKLATVAGWSFAIQRIQINAEPYIRLAGPKMAYNHWSLTVRASTEPTPLSDGVRVPVDVLDDSGSVVASSIDLTGIRGTQAGDALAAEHAGNTFQILGISTFDIPKLLSAVTDQPQSIPVPISFIVIGLKPAGQQS